MKTKRKFFVLLVLVIIVFAGCSKKAKDKTVTPTEFTEFNISEDYIISEISTTEDNHYAYISTRKAQIQSLNDFALFVCENINGTWSEPTQISFNNEIVPYTAAVSQDGSRLYISGNTSSEFMDKGMNVPLNIYKADIAGDVVRNISQMELENSDYFNLVYGTGINNQVFILSASQNQDTSKHLVCKEQDGKLVSDVVQMEGASVFGCLFLSENKVLASIHDESDNAVKCGTADISDGKLSNFKKLDADDLIKDTNIYNINISGDLKTLYLLVIMVYIR